MEAFRTRKASSLMEILPASLRDLGALRTLEHACFGRDAWSLLDLMAVLTFPDVIRLKAVDAGQSPPYGQKAESSR